MRRYDFGCDDGRNPAHAEIGVRLEDLENPPGGRPRCLAELGEAGKRCALNRRFGVVEGGQQHGVRSSLLGCELPEREDRHPSPRGQACLPGFVEQQREDLGVDTPERREHVTGAPAEVAVGMFQRVE